MKPVLAALPAFLTCFVGGWLLHPAAVEPTRQFGVLALMPMSGDRGYAAWVNEARKWPEQRDRREKASKEAVARAKEGKEMDGLLETLTNLKADKFVERCQEKSKQQKWYRAAKSEKEELENDLNRSKAAVEEEGNKIGQAMDFAARKEWYQHYHERLKEHQEKLAAYDKALKELAKGGGS